MIQSKNQLRKHRDRLREAVWQSYVTLLRFPVEIRPAYIGVLDMLRAELIYTTRMTEEKLYEEAMKVVAVMGEIKLVDVKPHAE